MKLSTLIGALAWRVRRDVKDYEAAAERWRKINAEKKAAGCRCGRPATRVRRYGGTMGGVPSEVWTCWEHRNVNGWSRVGDGPYVPNSYVAPETERWRVG